MTTKKIFMVKDLLATVEIFLNEVESHARPTIELEQHARALKPIVTSFKELLLKELSQPTQGRN